MAACSDACLVSSQPVRPRSRYRGSFTPTQLELFTEIRATGGLDEYCVIRHADGFQIHLPSLASKLRLPEERLRSTMLSMPGCHISRGVGHLVTTQVSGQSVRMPIAVWEQGMLESEITRSGTVRPTVASRMRERRSDADYQRSLVKQLHEDQREVAEAKQRRIDAREMIAQASRLNLGPTTGFGSFGFAGGAQGPSFQLASSDNYIYDPEDVSWMERFMPNGKKSTFAVSRHHEAKKKSKQSVSDYHNRLLGDKDDRFTMTPSKMRRMSTLACPGGFRKNEHRSRRTFTQISQPGLIPQCLHPGLTPRSQSMH